VLLHVAGPPLRAYVLCVERGPPDIFLLVIVSCRDLKFLGGKYLPDSGFNPNGRTLAALFFLSVQSDPSRPPPPNQKTLVATGATFPTQDPPPSWPESAPRIPRRIRGQVGHPGQQPPRRRGERGQGGHMASRHPQTDVRWPAMSSWWGGAHGLDTAVLNTRDREEARDLKPWNTANRRRCGTLDLEKHAERWRGGGSRRGERSIGGCSSGRSRRRQRPRSEPPRSTARSRGRSSTVGSRWRCSMTSRSSSAGLSRCGRPSPVTGTCSDGSGSSTSTPSTCFSSSPTRWSSSSCTRLSGLLMSTKDNNGNVRVVQAAHCIGEAIEREVSWTNTDHFDVDLMPIRIPELLADSSVLSLYADQNSWAAYGQLGLTIHRQTPHSLMVIVLPPIHY